MFALRRGEGGWMRLLRGVDMLGIEEKMGGAFAFGGLGDIANEICREKSGCANDASFNKDCTCLCSGLWSGASCDECDVTCGAQLRIPTPCGLEVDRWIGLPYCLRFSRCRY